MSEPPPGPRGRSAWPKAGAGGTLEWNGKTPGRYYCLAAAGMPLVGSGGWKSKDGNERATHGAVLAIQRALRRRLDIDLEITGVFDRATAEAASAFRHGIGQDSWGGIGPYTAKELWLPELQRMCHQRGIDQWQVVCGVIQNESSWDPGAVGYVKPVDIGLAQINGEAHPDMSEKERLSPTFSINFVISYLSNAMRALDGNLDHALASYNLGITGARRWLAAGAPEVYTPKGSVPRNILAYIDRIKSACDDGSPAVSSWT
jgi:hypothetical protein